MKRHFLIAVCIGFVFLQSCKKDPELPKSNPPQSSTKPDPIFSYEVVNTWHHDPEAFTQGLQFLEGELYESTGLNGRSSLRRVELQTGKILQQLKIDDQYFAEGMTILGDKIYQVTYQTHIGFVYDRKTFKKLSSWQYDGEGWGLTNDGNSILMSNGSNKIMYLDPITFQPVKIIEVFDEGYPVLNLNELEFIKGEIYANIWQTDRVARIDPTSGKVNSWIDLSGLLMPQERTERVDVLNGIAYDAAGDRFFVTGKLWPKLFEIKLKEKGIAISSSK